MVNKLNTAVKTLAILGALAFASCMPPTEPPKAYQPTNAEVTAFYNANSGTNAFNTAINASMQALTADMMAKIQAAPTAASYEGNGTVDGANWSFTVEKSNTSLAQNLNVTTTKDLAAGTPYIMKSGTKLTAVATTNLTNGSSTMEMTYGGGVSGGKVESFEIKMTMTSNGTSSTQTISSFKVNGYSYNPEDVVPSDAQ